jgi:uncharacterized protein YjiS (DUF1127 family)
MSTISSTYPYRHSLALPGGSDRLGTSATAWLMEGLATVATSIARAARARRDMRRLAGMDDRALRDIGLHRSEIERAVYGGRW